jgi:hypothetical protein
MNQAMMTQKQMTLANTAQENPTHRFTNLYSLMHWDYCHHAEHGFASNNRSNGKPRCGESRTSGLERGMGKTTWSNL